MKYGKRIENLEARRRDYEKMKTSGKDAHNYAGFKMPGSNKK